MRTDATPAWAMLKERNSALRRPGIEQADLKARIAELEAKVKAEMWRLPLSELLMLNPCITVKCANLATRLGELTSENETESESCENLI